RRALRRFADPRSWTTHGLVHAALLRRRGEAVRSSRASGPRAALLECGGAPATTRSSWRSRLAKDESESQAGHARHGRRAATSLRRTKTRWRFRVRRRHAVATGV